MEIKLTYFEASSKAHPIGSGWSKKTWSSYDIL